MWFSKKDIKQFQLPEILIKGLHGYVLPHAGTTYIEHILAHTLRFKPTKKFKNIIIFTINLFFGNFIKKNEKNVFT